MKRPSIKGKDFHDFHWRRRTNLRRVMGSFGICSSFVEEDENECVKGELISYV
jgi:hypothetical protein